MRVRPIVGITNCIRFFMPPDGMADYFGRL